MNSTFAVLLLAVASLYDLVVVAAQNGGSTCDEDIFTFVPRHSLNIQAFQGIWYEHEHASSHPNNTSPREPAYKCRSINLSQPNSTNPLLLTAAETYIDLETDELRTELSRIHIYANRSPVNSVWQHEDVATGQRSPMVVMAADLDFSQWAIIYHCQRESIGPENVSWGKVTVYGRTRNIDPEVRRWLKALMVGLGFRIGDHRTVRQDSC